MQNKTKNQSTHRALANQTKALTTFLTTVEPGDVKSCLHEMFIAYIPTESYSEQDRNDRHNILFAYHAIVDFLGKLSHAPHEANLKAEDALKALKGLTDQVEPNQAKETIKAMFNTYIITDDYCDSIDIERFSNVFHINTVIDFFSELDIRL